MKKALLLTFVLFQVSTASAASLRDFLKTCAYGTMAGAAAGVVSMGFTDNPGDSWGNVAKGASLGLYAGIAYGLYQMNKTPQGYQEPDFAVMPSFSEGKVDGVRLSASVFSF